MPVISSKRLAGLNRRTVQANCTSLGNSIVLQKIQRCGSEERAHFSVFRCYRADRKVRLTRQNILPSAKNFRIAADRNDSERNGGEIVAPVARSVQFRKFEDLPLHGYPSGIKCPMKTRGHETREIAHSPRIRYGCRNLR